MCGIRSVLFEAQLSCGQKGCVCSTHPALIQLAVLRHPRLCMWILDAGLQSGNLQLGLTVCLPAGLRHAGWAGRLVGAGVLSGGSGEGEGLFVPAHGNVVDGH